MAGRTIGLGGARQLWSQEDGVVVGHLGSSIDTYLAILDARRHQTRVGLWGHIKSYVHDGHPLDLALEKWQLRRSNHVFAYSPGGRDYAVAAGVPREHITTVMNTTDTTLLAQERRSLSQTDVQDYLSAHGLKPGRTLAYIGGLDASKRIAFMAHTLELLWLSDPDIKVLVGGAGSQSDLLKTAVSRGQVLMKGYVDPPEQAVMAAAAEALIMPGRIGLAAVDALVLGIPILTTSWRYHAPESEFLTEGESRFTSEDDPYSYARMIRNFLRNKNGLVFGHKADWNYPTIDSMVDNFHDGVVKMLFH